MGNLLTHDLFDLSDKNEERIAIVKKATASGWMSFYKTDKKRESSGTRKGKVKDNNNFDRRDYDMDALEGAFSVTDDELRKIYYPIEESWKLSWEFCDATGTLVEHFKLQMSSTFLLC